MKINKLELVLNGLQEEREKQTMLRWEQQKHKHVQVAKMDAKRKLGEHIDTREAAAMEREDRLVVEKQIALQTAFETAMAEYKETEGQKKNQKQRKKKKKKKRKKRKKDDNVSSGNLEEMDLDVEDDGKTSKDLEQFYQDVDGEMEKPYIDDDDDIVGNLDGSVHNNNDAHIDGDMVAEHVLVGSIGDDDVNKLLEEEADF